MKRNKRPANKTFPSSDEESDGNERKDEEQLPEDQGTSKKYIIKLVGRGHC